MKNTPNETLISEYWRMKLKTIFLKGERAELSQSEKMRLARLEALQQGRRRTYNQTQKVA
jgi:hypothetical protein